MSTNELRYIIVHHTAVSYRENPDQFLSVNKYHQDKWGMKSSLGYYGGYNYIISAEGIVRQYRIDGEETVAVVGHNYDSIHIALCGNFDLEYPSISQKTALQGLLKEKTIQYNILPQNIVPHRRFAPKTCYGSKLSDTWAEDLLTQQEKIGIVQNVLNSLWKTLQAILGKT